MSLSDTINGTNANATVYIPVDIEPSLFNNLSLPNSTAELGKDFSYDLSPFIRNASNVESIKVSVSPKSNYTEWIQVDPKSLKLYGTPPNESSVLTKRYHHRGRAVYRRAEDGEAIITIAATDARNGLESRAQLGLGISGLSSVMPKPTSSSSVSSTHSPTSPSTQQDKSGGLSTGAKIALGVVFGLVGLALIIGLLVFCCYRKRKNEKKQPGGIKSRKSAESFAGIVKSPKERSTWNPVNMALFGVGGGSGGMARSESARLQAGEVPKFRSVYMQPQEEQRQMDQTPTGAPVTLERAAEAPTQMGAMRGILKWDNQPKDSREEQDSIPGLDIPSPVPGEIIKTGTLPPPGGLSDFSHSFNSSSESRASWESRETFQWSSAEGTHNVPLVDPTGRPISSSHSVPRPRADFTPRYPRNALASNRPPSIAYSGHTFSEFHDNPTSEEYSGDSFQGSILNGPSSGGSRSLTHTRSRSGSGSGGLSSGSGSSGRDLTSRGLVPLGAPIPPVAEEDEGHYDDDTRSLDHHHEHYDEHDAPRLMPSREKFAVSPTSDHGLSQANKPSQEAIAENLEAFDDADESPDKERASTIYAPSDLSGLGYPPEALVFGNRDSLSMPRAMSMRSVVETREPGFMSPPLPQVGNLVETQVVPAETNATSGAGPSSRPVSSNAALNDGRYIAQTNETFNLHPYINPPPTVSLSASTWSSPSRSTYRIESATGEPLPKWLHWDANELELWGIPALGDSGTVISVKVIEKMPVEKRKSYDSSQLIVTAANERVVGSCVIE